ncbi:hypothetical protein BJ878DRAFT_539820 [Calycina marina]|uniref:Transmembrane protein n=1 Tax=Calycina marina TaxID=1763456 RepID=A0A9P7Z7B5_9HELO|nr:hypothetical protein BJ878DRAFT_539820 [Calycina marina]
MSASSVSSFFHALATTTPQQPGDDPVAGDVGSTADAGDSDAGASGSSSGSFTLSQGAIIGIAVAVSFVALFGIASSVLWYVAKKRSWEVRKTIRRSARKVATALTPRRTAFPKDIQKRRSKMSKIDEVPPTPRLREDFGDIEKGSRHGNSTKISSFELSEPPKKSKWAQQQQKR